MKKYIIMVDGISGIGGGQLHYRRAIADFENRGFKGYILTFLENHNIRIEELQKYSNNVIPELEFFPEVFSKKRRKKVLSQMEKIIDYNEGDEVVIESTMIPCSVWGELLAKKCNGKNIVYLLGEKFPQDAVKSALSFLLYKHKQGNLASISKAIMHEMFLPYVDIPMDECVSLRALSWNTPENVPLPNDIWKNDNEITIAIFSRLSKPFVKSALRDVVEYCSNHLKKNFYLLLIGKEPTDSKFIKDNLENKSNIRYKITGELYPVPIKLFDIIDVGVSSSGVAGIMGNYVPTVAYDAVNLVPIGVLGYDTVCVLTNNDNSNAKSAAEYFDLILNNKCADAVSNYALYRRNLDKHGNSTEEKIDAHFAFASVKNGSSSYFQEKIKVSVKRRILSLLPKQLKHNIKIFLKTIMGRCINDIE